jgi:NTP pyrophosphatase (non-canonical NTP hydrolase)
VSLDFTTLRDANVRRCNQVFHKLDAWDLPRWGNAVAGETGELCNVIKKIDRDGSTPELLIKLRKEAADVLIYLDLLAARARFDLGQAVKEKFNEVSMKRLSNVFLDYDPAQFHRNPQPGAFIRFNQPGGSVGVIESVAHEDTPSARFYGRFFYGRDNAGDFMTASFGLRRDEFVLTQRDVFMKVADKPGFGKGE